MCVDMFACMPRRITPVCTKIGIPVSSSDGNPSALADINACVHIMNPSENGSIG